MENLRMRGVEGWQAVRQGLLEESDPLD